MSECSLLLEDFDDVLAVRWMIQLVPELHAVAEKSRNGRSLLCRTVIASGVLNEARHTGSTMMIMATAGREQVERRNIYCNRRTR